MTVRIIKCFVVFAFFTLAIQGLFANPTTASPRNEYETQRTVSVPEETCPPITNLKLAFLPPDRAFASWDAVPGVSQYAIRVTDDNQTTILDTVVYQNSLIIEGLVSGDSYTIEVCYNCEASNTPVCTKMDFDYVIIDDLVVMLQGNPCKCQNMVYSGGSCPDSISAEYDLNENWVYNVTLENSSKLSFFVESGNTKIVGNCQSNITGLGAVQNGAGSPSVDYLDLEGGAQIHFYPTTFCVSGLPVISMKSCEIAPRGELSGLKMDEMTSSLVLFPNPFSDVVYVQTDELHDYTGTTSVLVYDAAGRLVLAQEVPSEPLSSGLFEINTSTFWAGFYWVSLVNNGVSLTTKRMIKVN